MTSRDSKVSNVQLPFSLSFHPNLILEIDTDANEMSGKLNWSVGYYERAPLLKEMEKPEKVPTPPPTTTLVEQETMMPGEKAPLPAKTPPPPPADPYRTP